MSFFTKLKGIGRDPEITVGIMTVLRTGFLICRGSIRGKGFFSLSKRPYELLGLPSLLFDW